MDAILIEYASLCGSRPSRGAAKSWKQLANRIEADQRSEALGGCLWALATMRAGDDSAARSALKALKADSSTKSSPIVWVSLALLEAELGKTSSARMTMRLAKLGCPLALEPLKKLDEGIRAGDSLQQFNPFDACGAISSNKGAAQGAAAGGGSSNKAQPAKIAAMMSQSLEAVAARRKKGGSKLGLPMRVPAAMADSDADDSTGAPEAAVPKMPRRPAGIGSLSPVQETEASSSSSTAAASSAAAPAGAKSAKSVAFALPDYIKDFAPRRKSASSQQRLSSGSTGAAIGGAKTGTGSARKASTGTSASAPGQGRASAGRELGAEGGEDPLRRTSSQSHAGQGGTQSARGANTPGPSSGTDLSAGAAPGIQQAASQPPPTELGDPLTTPGPKRAAAGSSASQMAASSAPTSADDDELDLASPEPFMPRSTALLGGEWKQERPSPACAGGAKPQPAPMSEASPVRPVAKPIQEQPEAAAEENTAAAFAEAQPASVGRKRDRNSRRSASQMEAADQAKASATVVAPSSSKLEPRPEEEKEEGEEGQSAAKRRRTRAGEASASGRSLAGSGPRDDQDAPNRQNCGSKGSSHSAMEDSGDEEEGEDKDEEEDEEDDVEFNRGARRRGRSDSRGRSRSRGRKDGSGSSSSGRGSRRSRSDRSGSARAESDGTGDGRVGAREAIGARPSPTAEDVGQATKQEGSPTIVFKKSSSRKGGRSSRKRGAEEQQEDANRGGSGRSSASRAPGAPRSGDRKVSPSDDQGPVSVLFGGAQGSRSVIHVNGNPYLRLDVVGKGGSSKVFRVLGKDLGVYALKRIRLSRMDRASLASYTNEIALLQRLRHGRHIVQLREAQVDVGSKTIYVVMELGETDLHGLLKRERTAAKEREDELDKLRAGAKAGKRGRGPASPSPADRVPAETVSTGGLDENFIRLVWQQMLLGVRAIHEARVVHGDLKPANFVFVQGVLKLIDFGIAKAISADTTNIYRETQVGTINYMSPEAILDTSAQAGGAAAAAKHSGMRMRVGRASDIWSLGCILYLMVYGRTPFADLSLIQKLRCITDETYEIPFPELPPRHGPLLEVMRACLRRDPRDRPTIDGRAGLLEHAFLRPEGVAAAAAPALPKGAIAVDKSTVQSAAEALTAPGVMAAVGAASTRSTGVARRLGSALFEQLRGAVDGHAIVDSAQMMADAGVKAPPALPQQASSSASGSSSSSSSSSSSTSSSAAPQSVPAPSADAVRAKLALAAAIGSVESGRGSRRRGLRSKKGASQAKDSRSKLSGASGGGGVSNGLAAGIAAAAGARKQRVQEKGGIPSPRASKPATGQANGGSLATALRERQANLRHVDADVLKKPKAAAGDTAGASAMGQLLKQRFAKVQNSLPAHLKRAPADGETGEISWIDG